MELGAGVHGEAGIEKLKMGTAKEIVQLILEKVCLSASFCVIAGTRMGYNMYKCRTSFSCVFHVGKSFYAKVVTYVDSTCIIFIIGSVNISRRLLFLIIAFLSYYRLNQIPFQDKPAETIRVEFSMEIGQF